MRKLGYTTNRGTPSKIILNQTPEEFEHTFWSKVIAGPNNCILWIGPRARGYGIVHNPITKKQEVASRVAFKFHFGIDPKGFDVCHKCDNPPCINPNHLFLGTRKDNMQDSSLKRRMKMGESHYKSKMTSDSVIKLRGMYKFRITGYTKLAALFGISQKSARDIIHRKNWKHI